MFSGSSVVVPGRTPGALPPWRSGISLVRAHSKSTSSLEIWDLLGQGAGPARVLRSTGSVRRPEPTRIENASAGWKTFGGDAPKQVRASRRFIPNPEAEFGVGCEEVWRDGGKIRPYIHPDSRRDMPFHTSTPERSMRVSFPLSRTITCTPIRGSWYQISPALPHAPSPVLFGHNQQGRGRMSVRFPLEAARSDGPGAQGDCMLNRSTEVR